jgi:hypothetical protein
MTEQTEYQYNVFISYSHTDEKWVHGWLLPRLEAAGYTGCRFSGIPFTCEAQFSGWDSLM